MAEFLIEISKKVFPRIWQKIDEHEKKIKELDPENVSAKLKKTIEEIETFKEKAKVEFGKALAERATDIAAELKKASEQAVKESIKSLSSSLDEFVKEKGEEHDEKIEKFISSSQKTAKIIWTQISEAINAALEPILAEKPKK